jgi:hypothetical protein
MSLPAHDTFDDTAVLIDPARLCPGMAILACHRNGTPVLPWFMLLELPAVSCSHTLSLYVGYADGSVDFVDLDTQQLLFWVARASLPFAHPDSTAA